jgi:hypothetical protein
MEAIKGTKPAEISRVAVRLPPYWAERPAVWFAQAEAQFSLAGISSERSTFHYVTFQQDQRYTAEVEDIISSPRQQDPYSKLRTKLLKRLSLSREQRAHRILTLEEMGDRKPSQFLRHLRSLLPGSFLRNIWTSRLPAKVQATLACHPEVELDAAADCDDRIIETVPPPALASIGQPTDKTSFRGASRNPFAGWRLSALRGTSPSPETVVPAPVTVHLVPGTLTPAAETAPSAPETAAPTTGHPQTWCFNNLLVSPTLRKPGAKLFRALHLQPAGKLTQQTLATANVCATATGRLFIIGKSNKQRFLIDPGSDLCVFPRKLRCQLQPLRG